MISVDVKVNHLKKSKVKDNVMKKREQLYQNENAKQLCQFSK